MKFGGVLKSFGAETIWWCGSLVRLSCGVGWARLFSGGCCIWLYMVALCQAERGICLLHSRKVPELSAKTWKDSAASRIKTLFHLLSHSQDSIITFSWCNVSLGFKMIIWGGLLFLGSLWRCSGWNCGTLLMHWIGSYWRENDSTKNLRQNW